VVLGDLNGRVGSRQEDWEIVHRDGEEVVNENGESFLKLCRGGDMIIMNGWFPYKKVRKMTFVQRMVTQRDRAAILHYFCVSKELKKFVEEVDSFGLVTLLCTVNKTYVTQKTQQCKKQDQVKL
jgi:hypothetical protein